MMAKKYIGNTINLIDWDIVIENLSKIKGEFRGYETPYERETSLESTELEYDYLRNPDNEIEPLVIDLVDDFSTFKRLGDKRNKFYQKKNYDIENIEFLDPKENGTNNPTEPKKLI